MEFPDLVQLYNNMPLGVFFLDAEHVITDINPAACHILGLTSGQVVGHPIADPLWVSVYEDGTDFPVNQHPAVVALREGNPVQNTIMGVYNQVLENYSWIMVDAFPQYAEGHTNPRGAMCIMEEITKLKQVADDLIQSNERFYLTFEEGPLPMTFLGSDFRFIKTNAPFRKMIGYTEEELELMTFKEITHPEHLAQDSEAVKKVVYGVIPYYKTDKRYIRKDRQVLWASLTLFAIHNNTGHFVHLLAMVQPFESSAKGEVNQ
ncbi:MAG: PAS domain S-box protein [Bacteroidales bacterium]|nr:PAS domain S-box protein [Bacteroidales bacterium]